MTDQPVDTTITTDTTTNGDAAVTIAQAIAELTRKARVHEIAKQFGISSRLLVDELTAQGATVKSASSGVDPEAARNALTVLAERGQLTAPAAAAPPAAAPPAAGGVDEPVQAVGAAGAFGVPMFVEPAATEPPSRPAATDDGDEGTPDVDADRTSVGETDADGPPSRSRRRRGRRGRGRPADDNATADDESGGADSAAADDAGSADAAGSDEAAGSDDQTDGPEAADQDESGDDQPDDAPSGSGSNRNRRRRRRGRPDRPANAADTGASGDADTEEDADEAGDQAAEDADDGAESGGSASSRRRRRRRRGSSGDDGVSADDPTDTVVHVREPRTAESQVQGVRGSTRLEAKRQRRRESMHTRRRPQILTEAEFLARREAVHRVMAVRQRGELSQVALLEDGVLVEHFVSRAGSASMIGNVYLGRVQNVLPSMEAAFVDIGRGRNAVLYAGEVDWEAAGLAGKSRKIETALSSGDTVLVQVSKDPIGHKGARLTTQISLPGRFLVYVPGGGATGISRKLPDTERKRLKSILDRIVPSDAGVIIRTAAEGIEEAELADDVERLKAQWAEIQTAGEPDGNGRKPVAPRQLYAEPDTLIKVIRDLFNSDIDELIVDGEQAWESVSAYVTQVAPDLADRMSRFDGVTDVFAAHRIDEQVAKALERKVFLPSGGSLVIDRTEAMTVIDVNTGKYTGSGGNLEETVTRNNLEAAEEVVRQLRLRDIGGIIVVDFVDMVLESNRELVLRRLTECLGRDRTRHQVAEVTSLGLVQMTRKRLGTGLLEAFSEPCEHCHGRGVLLRDVPVDHGTGEIQERTDRPDRADRTERGGRRRRGREPEPVVVAQVAAPRRDPRGPRPPGDHLGRRRRDRGDVDEVADETGSDSAEGGSVETVVAAIVAEAVIEPPIDPVPDRTDADAPAHRSRCWSCARNCSPSSTSWPPSTATTGTAATSPGGRRTARCTGRPGGPVAAGGRGRAGPTASTTCREPTGRPAGGCRPDGRLNARAVGARCRRPFAVTAGRRVV